VTDRTDTSYSHRPCPTCLGTGINPVEPYLLCPKCCGERVVPLPVPSWCPRCGQVHGPTHTCPAPWRAGGVDIW
jgi:hypothetical protein